MILGILFLAALFGGITTILIEPSSALRFLLWWSVCSSVWAIPIAVWSGFRAMPEDEP